MLAQARHISPHGRGVHINAEWGGGLVGVEQSRLEHSRLHVARGLVNARFKKCSVLCAACWLLAAVEHFGLEHLRVLTLLALKPTHSSMVKLS